MTNRAQTNEVLEHARELDLAIREKLDELLGLVEELGTETRIWQEGSDALDTS